MKKTRIILISLSCLFSSSGLAQSALVPSDTTYWTKSSPWIQYIYPRERESSLSEVDHYMQFFKAKYDLSFAWALDEKVKLALASDQNQVANGFATVSPFLQTMHYPVGTEILDSFAEDSFLFALASHETAHLYQLSAKSSLSSTIKSIVGNTLYLQLPIVVPIFIFPNATLPAFMLEGNAVLNESVVGHGGRLWSGEVRSEVLAQVKAGKSGPSRLINQNADYPRSEDYHYGGYFFAYLAERFGVDKTNQFYINHAMSEFWPFNMNKTFRRHFGVSYTRLIHDFDLWLKPLLSQFQEAHGQILTHTYTRPRFNQDSQQIYFVHNPTGRTSNQLCRFAIQEQNLLCEKTDLPTGKAFFVDQHYYTVSSEQINPTNIKYALFGEGLTPKPETINFIYQDVRAGHTLAVDARHSYQHASLVKDGQFLDESGSSAILDDAGRAYYFRQAGSERVLYRDREPLFKYQGYYGIPTEIGSSGEVYFIASTHSGASLFRWKNQQIEQMFKADNVVDARQVNEDLFLVAANDSSGFQIQLLKPEPQNQLPAWYVYKLPNQMPPLPSKDQVSLALSKPEHEYSTLQQLRFSQANLQSSGLKFTRLSAVFTDPLWWNTLMLAGESHNGDYGGALAYQNTRHRLGGLLSAVYQNDKRTLLNGQTYRKIQSDVFLGFNYALLKWRRWSGRLHLGPTWKEENTTGPVYQRRYGGLLQMIFNYQRLDGHLAYEPYRHLTVHYIHRTEASAATGRKIDSTNAVDVSIGGDLYQQTFFDLSGSWGLAETDSLDVTYLKDNLLRNFSLPTYLTDGNAKEVREFSATLKQVIDWSYYFPRFPLSVRRIAPFVTFKDTFAKQNNIFSNLPVWRQELSFGNEIEILVFHNLVTRLTPSFSSIKIGGSIQQEWQVNWGLSQSF